MVSIVPRLNLDLAHEVKQLRKRIPMGPLDEDSTIGMEGLRDKYQEAYDNYLRKKMECKELKETLQLVLSHYAHSLLHIFLLFSLLLKHNRNVCMVRIKGSFLSCHKSLTHFKLFTLILTAKNNDSLDLESKR